MYKVVAVEYINTLPFIKAFQEDEYLRKHTRLRTAIPRDCALALQQNQADIVLLPIGSFNDFEQLYTVSHFGIASDGHVHTVGIFSNKPWNEVQTVSESGSSRSSNLLMKVLNERLWNSNIEIVQDVNSDAKLIIGDEAFSAHSKYTYFVDLAAEWKKLTGLPFVFASWMSRKKIDEDFKHHLNQSFKKYTDAFHLSAIAKEFAQGQKEIDEYYKRNIHFPLEQSMLEAIQLFYSLNNWKWNLD